MTITKDQLIEHISKMSVLELSELVKELEEKFNVSATVVAAPAVAPAAEVEEKTKFDVILKAIGANKISVIKELRVINPSLGLAEAKKLAESASDTTKILEDASKESAEEVAKKLKNAGADAVVA